MMKRGYIFQKPTHDDEDDYHRTSRIVHAKPIDERLKQKLGQYGSGKDFVMGNEKSQQELIIGATEKVDETNNRASSSKVLSKDEHNKISAKILKAEMKGNKELADKLRRKLAGFNEDESNQSSSHNDSDNEKVQLLLKTDKRSGLTMPLSSAGPSGLPKHQQKPSKTSDGKYNLGSVDAEYRSQMSIHEMANEERITSAREQLSMFNRATKATVERKTDDDWVVDDAIMSHKRKMKYDERDERKKRNKAIQDYKSNQRTLDTCSLCIDSHRFIKHCVVAIGIKTYLCTVPWRPLVEGHSIILPSGHYSSTVTLDEDVYDEMRIWRKGLVAMWKSQDMDCVFVEMTKNDNYIGHTFIECIPLPIEIGETAPIYFKKAINESEGEWCDNKKLIELSKYNGDIRKIIPKGFSYFSIDFGLQPGYAHVIEDHNKFPTNFAHEIIGGMLDLDHKRWRRPEKIGTDEQKKNCDHLKKLWNPFDWTEKVKQSINQ